VHEEACAGFMARDATCFPQAIGQAATWARPWSRRWGRVIRTQMRAVGAHHALAPVLDVTRDPRWGRVEETYGEDPYLVARMGVAYVRGVQGDRSTTASSPPPSTSSATALSEGGLNWAPARLMPRELREVSPRRSRPRSRRPAWRRP
jgi:beta-glucosidase